MSGFYKYVDHCPNVAGSLPDDITEGDSDYGLELEALFMSNSSTGIINASIEIITVSASEDKPEDLEAGAEVSKSSRDEGVDDVDDGKDDLVEEESEGRKSQQRDDGVVPLDVHGLDAFEEDDEVTRMWRKLGLQPYRGQVNLVKENRQKLQDRIGVIWQELRLVIIETFKNHGRMIYSEEGHQLKQELVLVTNMTLIMEQRLELLQLLAMEVELGPEY